MAVREKAVYRVKQRTGAIRGNDGKIAKFRENLSILEGFPRAVRQDITSLNAAPTAKSRQAQKAAAQAAKRTQQAARTSIKAAKLTVRAVVTAVKTAISAVRTLIAAIAAGGWVAVLIILVICVIGLLVGSVYGIFSGDDSNTSQGIPVRQAAEVLDAEF